MNSNYSTECYALCTLGGVKYVKTTIPIAILERWGILPNPSDLFDAVQGNDVPKILKWVKGVKYYTDGHERVYEHFSPNTVCPNTELSVLGMSIIFGSYDVFLILLEKEDADVHQSSKYGSPLELAVMHFSEDSRYLKAILSQKGIDVLNRTSYDPKDGSHMTLIEQIKKKNPERYSEILDMVETIKKENLNDLLTAQFFFPDNTINSAEKEIKMDADLLTAQFFFPDDDDTINSAKKEMDADLLTAQFF